MARTTGRYHKTTFGDETVHAFLPRPLPPQRPKLQIDEEISAGLAGANAAIEKLAVAAAMVPNADWFLYGFVRKEAVVSSQIEGTQATLQEVLEYEVTAQGDRLDDVREVCNYVDALNYARREIGRPRGLPLGIRLLCGAHKRLMRGVRGAEKLPGEIRRSQNWIGGTRPGNAKFVPPPPENLLDLLATLEKWMHSKDPLPPLIKAGLAHVQFETIHPFLDGNGRLGRLLITLLLEHWQLLDHPILYLSLALKRRQSEYYKHLSAVRREGDWEGWCRFFLECVQESAEDGVVAAQRLFTLMNENRQTVLAESGATVSALRLLHELPNQPILTLAKAMEILGMTKPTTSKAIEVLSRAGVLHEVTGKKRDRIYAYQNYLDILSQGTNL